ncbi:MAG: hypothetical protein GY909_00695 [Oligoflexia bacterium]|nr:hypothetical protein [Oligoflexia bacterium]
MLTDLLSSKTRSELLRILFDGRGTEHYLRDLERLSKIKISSIQKEVKNLVGIDLLESRKDGNRLYFKANTTHPIYSDIVSIVSKTVGVEKLLSEALDDKRISCAFIFGSYATGEMNSGSDIDLFIVGEIKMMSLLKLISGISEKVSRPINPHIYSKSEITEKMKRSNHFVSSIKLSETKVLRGDPNDYFKAHSKRSVRK